MDPGKYQEESLLGWNRPEDLEKSPNDENRPNDLRKRVSIDEHQPENLRKRVSSDGTDRKI
jgi:hypothetical protein